MVANKMKEKLKELGFSDKEAQVYLALLGLGSSPVSVIAKRAGINRSTAYVILESLLGRGLVSITKRGSLKLFNSTPPERLIQYLEGMAKRYTGLADTARDILPKLKAPRRSIRSVKPKVQIFEGTEGIKTVYEDTLASLETIRAYASFGNPKQASKSPVIKKNTNIKIQTIFPDTRQAQELMTHNKEIAQKLFSSHQNKSGFSSEINIYDNKIIFISPAEKFALVVESRELADALKKALESSRKEVARLSKKSLFSKTAMAEGVI